MMMWSDSKDLHFKRLSSLLTNTTPVNALYTQARGDQFLDVRLFRGKK